LDLLPFTPLFFDFYGCEPSDFFLSLEFEVVIPALVVVQVRVEAEV
jgi:hypothetical protein